MTSPARPIRVLIADDHRVVRQGLRTFLGCKTTSTWSERPRTGSLPWRWPIAAPDDSDGPGHARLDGIEATRRIRTAGGAQVIALTSFTEDDKVFPAIEAGAAGYLLKDVTPDDLVEAIRAAARGEARLHPNVARRLMAEVSQRRSGTPVEPAGSMTPRELEVIRLVAQGKTNLEIARELVISDKTVKTHISHILGKLGLQDRTQLAVYAFNRGIVEKGVS
jgi:NarL family two-component system response regulator LiaR